MANTAETWSSGNDDSPRAFIFFVEGRVDLSLRAARRQPKLLREIVANRIISTLTRSPITHCALGIPPYVVEATYGGSRVYDFGQWIEGQSRLCGWFAIKAKDWPPNVWEFVKGDRRLNLVLYEGLSLIHWLSRGIVPCDDCVAVVRRGLAGCGIDLPRKVVSAAGLWEYLHGRGYIFNPCDHRPVSGVVGAEDP